MNDPITRIPLAHKIRYRVTGAPPLTGAEDPGLTMTPALIELVYVAACIGQPARVDAMVTGPIEQDGSPCFGGDDVAWHYQNGPAGWPDWLADEAKDNDPARLDPPSRFHATPADVHNYLCVLLAEDAHLRYQQALGELVLAEAVEDAGVVRAGADNEGLYNASWREGWDDASNRVDPDQNAPTPHRLLAVTDDELDREPEVDGFGMTPGEYRLSTKVDAPAEVEPHNFTAEYLGEVAAKRRLPNCAECSQPATAAVHDGDQSAETRHLRALLTA